MSEPTKPREWTVVGTYSPSFEDCCTILDGPSIGKTKFRVREVSPEIDAAIEAMREALNKIANVNDGVVGHWADRALEAYDAAVKRGAV